MVIIMSTWIYLSVLILIFESVDAEYADDSDLSITQIIEKYGYPVETHNIETEDGYLLEIYRIPYGRRSRIKRANPYPVILNHGLLGSAENFILLGPKRSLAFMLADNGYDVWLSNARGSWHSRKHKTLDPDKDVAFWQFSWHEIGVYDLPAVIDYILKITNTEKLHFIGHSQGTTTFFVLCSEKPEYNRKIKLMVAMAPSAIMRHFDEPILKLISPMYPSLQKFSSDVKQHEMIPFVSNSNLRAAGKMLCGKNNLIPLQVCGNIVSQLLEDIEMDKEVLPLFLSTAPAGASVNQALHYAQLVTAGVFRKYDYGPRENMIRYNSKTPPEYNLKNVIAPIALIYGETDNMVRKEDVAILEKLLPNVVELYKVPAKTWTHMDFIWARNVDSLLYNKIMAVMKTYDDK